MYEAIIYIGIDFRHIKSFYPANAYESQQMLMTNRINYKFMCLPPY